MLLCSHLLKMNLKIALLATLMQFSVTFPVAAQGLSYEPGFIYMYEYETDIILNEPQRTKATKPVGFRLKGVVKLNPVWQGNNEQLVRLTLTHLQVRSLSRDDIFRDVKASGYPLYFVWKEGRVERVFATAKDLTLSVNLKKGVASLLQLQQTSGTRRELDATGECEVRYEARDDRITKHKARCEKQEIAGHYSSVNKLLGLNHVASEVAEYYLEDDRIKTVNSQSSFYSTVNMRQSLVVGMLVTQSLSTAGITGGAEMYEGASVDTVISQLNQKEKLSLPMLLGTDSEIKHTAKQSKTEDLIAKYRQHLDSSHVGQTISSRAFVELVDAFRQTKKAAVVKIFKDENNADIMPQLIDITVAAQTPACQKALLEVLDFSREEETHLEERYLVAMAFTTHPSEDTLTDILTLYRKNVHSLKLRTAISGSLGAMLHTFCQVEHQCQSEIVEDISKEVVRKLNQCEDADCKLQHLLALSNAGQPGTIPRLLQEAEDAKEGVVSEAAIKALHRMPRETMDDMVKSSMRRIFHQNKRLYDTAARSEALDILLKNDPTRSDIKQIMLAMTDHLQHGFSSFIRAKLYTRMGVDIVVRDYVREYLVDQRINNYYVWGQSGNSMTLSETMADTESTTARYNMYTLNSNAGRLKRSGNDIEMFGPLQALPLFSMDLFSEGMEALLGEEVDEGTGELEPTGGLAVGLLGVSLPPITFFTGKSALMSAVWSAPSEPTPALQINLLLQDHFEKIHLQNGFIAELNVKGAVSLDLSGSITISLWYKQAKSLLTNSAALEIQGSLSVNSPVFLTSINFSAGAASALNFKSDVDFSDKIISCLQLYRPSHTFRHNVTKYEHMKGFKKSYHNRVTRAKHIGEASYPLPQLNSLYCRHLASTMEE